MGVCCHMFSSGHRRTGQIQAITIALQLCVNGSPTSATLPNSLAANTCKFKAANLASCARDVRALIMGSLIKPTVWTNRAWIKSCFTMPAYMTWCTRRLGRSFVSPQHMSCWTAPLVRQTSSSESDLIAFYFCVKEKIGLRLVLLAWHPAWCIGGEARCPNLLLSINLVYWMKINVTCELSQAPASCRELEIFSSSAPLLPPRQAVFINKYFQCLIHTQWRIVAHTSE